MSRIFRILLTLAIAGLAMSAAGVACNLNSTEETENLVTVVVTEADAGKAIELDSGQGLTVRLASNHSTGYGWTLTKSGDSLQEAAGNPVYESPAAESTTTPIGAGGTDVFSFSALTPGQESLKFDYSRAWETGKPPAQSVSYSITVR